MSRIKEDLIAALEELASLMELAGENRFRVNAYRKGAASIREGATNEEDLNLIAKGKIKLEGVGAGLQAAISEFLSDGALKDMSVWKEKVPAGLLELREVPGLGPKKAKQIVEELGITSLGELEYACKENRLLSLKGFGEQAQQKILTSLEKIKSRKGHYLISDAFAYAESMEIAFRESGWTQIHWVGSLSRSSEVISLFEFLLVDSLESELKLPATFYLDTSSSKEVSIFSTRLKSISGVYDSEIQFKIWRVQQEPSEELLKWLQSSDELKNSIQESSKRFINWEPSWLEKENALRVPNARTYRRSKAGGVKGIFHNHTTESDGKATLEEMVIAAEKKGFEYIGISDHSASAFYAQGLKSERLLEQKHVIKKLQDRVNIRIFHGVESDILQDGSLDYPDETLAELDFVVASIHSRFQMGIDEMTSRICRALLHPATTFWGHPTGRLLLSRDGYALHWEKMFQVLHETGVIIELNAHPQRLDVDWRWGSNLEKNKISLSIHPDAHSLEGLNDTCWGEKIAEKAMLSQDLIFNLKPLKEVEAYLWQRKQKSQNK